MQFEILKILADGRFHSGDEMGSLLGISRAGVWKQIKKLDDMGIECHSVRGKGYKVPGGLELLDKEKILAAMALVHQPLPTQASLVNLYYSVDSTNNIAMQSAQKGVASGFTCIAEQQTSGRGRRGRHWVSPFARNVYMSTAWHFDQGVGALEGLSLATGVAVARALKRARVPGVQLKWPNDILGVTNHGGKHSPGEYKKLAGILLEMAGNAADQCQIVIGIGVNLAMPLEAGERIGQPWTDLESMLGYKPDRNQLVGYVLGEVLNMLTEFQREGFQPFWQEWLSLDIYRDKCVELIMAENTVSGISRGINQTGALVLETEQGIKHFSGGEISLRAIL
ncbi:MAG TPA: bifunctional biotin--[acetyl-CoA-carboxylase] ligase/biotin operon repressor BirA [Pseudomonadales bacterium]